MSSNESKLTPVHKGEICPYCGTPPRYVDSAVVYGGVSYGMIYLCTPCKAYVGVHPGTSVPLGRLANEELRAWKKKAHNYFDPIWKNKVAQGANKAVVRNEAYAWLSEAMNLDRELTHIGMMDVEQCKRVVELCTNSLSIPNDMHACEIIYKASPEHPTYGNEPGVCRVTGKETYGVPFHTWVRDTFTDFASLKPGTIISNEALFCFEEASVLIQKIKAKDKPQRFRTYSHFVNKGTWYVLGKDQKAEILTLLLDPDTSVSIIAESGQKHLAFKHKIGMWMFEEVQMLKDVETFKWLHETLYELGQVFSVEEVHTGVYQQHRMMQFGIHKWAAFEQSLKKHRGTALFNLAIFFIKVKNENHPVTVPLYYIKVNHDK